MEHNEPGMTYGPDSYSNYSYGNYTYSNRSQAVYEAAEEPKPVKKRGGVAARVLAVVLSLTLVAGAVGSGAYFILPGVRQWVSSITQKAPAAQETESAWSGFQEEAAAPEDTSASIAPSVPAVTTTVSTDSPVVVTDVTKVVANSMPAVVSIDNNYIARTQTFFGAYEQELTGTGTGIIIGQTDTELLIATNYHVVQNAESLQVHFIDEAAAGAEIKGTNVNMDLAVVAVPLQNLTADTLGAISIATLGDSDALQLGEPVIAIGNALGYGQSVTSGIVSAINREVQISKDVKGTYIQTDAAINEGNSGGALLNSKGEVIGINSAKIGGYTVEGMGFAIPITLARETIEKLMNQETRTRVSDAEKGYFGISVMTPQGINGAYVEDVQTGGAADQAGIRPGDVIVRVDGIDIASRQELTNTLNYYPAGTTVSVTVLRMTSGGLGEVDVTVTLQSAEESGVTP